MAEGESRTVITSVTVKMVASLPVECAAVAGVGLHVVRLLMFLVLFIVVHRIILS